MGGELGVTGTGGGALDPALIQLIAASLAFVGTHFAMSHPLRPWLMKLGQNGFMAAYTLVSLATFVWMVMAFKAAPPGDLGGSGEIGWLLATLITLPALALFVGSLNPGNPAMPTPGAAAAARAGPKGVFLVTRHPMMWGFAMWAVSHILLWWSWRTNVIGLAILLLALLGAHLQDRKKRALMGGDWIEWETKTSYWPRWSRLGAAGAKIWIVAIVLWALLTWMHLPIGGIPAGLWRWVG